MLSSVPTTYGFPVPYLAGAGLAMIGVVLAATQVEDAVAPGRAAPSE